MVSAHAEAAHIAAKYVTGGRRIVDLTGGASFRRTVEEAGVVAQEAAHGEFVKSRMYLACDREFAEGSLLTV
jgi:hypothetical protein